MHAAMHAAIIITVMISSVKKFLLTMCAAMHVAISRPAKTKLR